MNKKGAGVRQILCATICLLISGCDLSLAPARGVDKPDVSQLNGFVNLDIAIPQGYCVNGKHSTQSQSRAFALIEDCEADPARGRYAVSMLKLSGDAKMQSVTAIANAFADNQGQTILSASGLTSDTTLDQRTLRDIHYVRTKSASDAPLQSSDPDVWRAFFIRSGSLYSVSFWSSANTKMSEQERFDRVQDFARSLKM